MSPSLQPLANYKMTGSNVIPETRSEPSGNAEDVDQRKRRPFTFHIGTSWAGKSSVNRSRFPHSSDTALGSWRDYMLSSARNFPGSTEDAGEDFFFIQQMRNQSGVSFGVADGVGSWTKEGVDPSLFPQALMYYAYQLTGSAWAGNPEIDLTTEHEERENIESQELGPYECLELAFNSVLQEEAVKAGSSTACIITINSSSGILRSANLGDSGYSVIRSDTVLYTSPPQGHSFNTPKQLVKRGRSYSPQVADQHEVQLCDGDIVIAYTDGLTDNVFLDEVVNRFKDFHAAGETEDERVQKMADDIASYAQMCMMSLKVTPFECMAEKAGMKGLYTGGKTDDIVVIVALVRETT